MSVRKAIPEHSGIYFLTITCRGWHHLFSIAEGYSAVYQWFDYLKSKGHFIAGYVIIPNHLHALSPRSGRLCGDEMDVFINAKIIRGRVFLRYNNLLKAFMKSGNVPTPFYPGVVNVVDFGFDWSFYD